MRRTALAILLFTVATPALAQIVPPQNSKPVPTAKIDTIPAARDIAFPGTMQLTVDASDVTRGIFRIHQTVPVPGPGDFVMLYPQWVPGGHSPRNDIKNVTGLPPDRQWPAAEMEARHARRLRLPHHGPGGRDVDRPRLSYVTPTDNSQGRILATPDMASIQWLSNTMYPAGYYVRQIPVQASVVVPRGWKVGTALRPSGQTASRTATGSIIR